jgi:hypothetical protein
MFTPNIPRSVLNVVRSPDRYLHNSIGRARQFFSANPLMSNSTFFNFDVVPEHELLYGVCPLPSISSSPLPYSLSPRSALAVLKSLPRDFTISTAHHKCDFNAYVLSHFSPQIQNYSGGSWRLQLTDPDNCLASFARLLSGSPVRFDPAHWSAFSLIARELKVSCLPQWFSNPANSSEMFACQINANSVISVFRSSTIITRSHSYLVNYFGALFSSVLVALPIADRIYIDVDDRYFAEFEPWQEIYIQRNKTRKSF